MILIMFLDESRKKGQNNLEIMVYLTDNNNFEIYLNSFLKLRPFINYILTF